MAADEGCGNGVEVGEPVCGNGVVEAETCDDGITITEACDYGTTCPICTSECIEEERNGPFCGDGIVNADNGEACDAGGSSAPCDDALSAHHRFYLRLAHDHRRREHHSKPLESGYAYSNVQWGDGSVSTITSHSGINHTYAAAGDYTIRISGTLEKMFFNNGGDKDKIIAIPNLGSVGWKNFDRAFRGCTNLGQVDGGDTSQVTTMNQMFLDATNVQPDCSTWDTSSVSNMNSMFKNATNATPNTSNWNTANVTNMSYMLLRHRC